LSRRSCAENNCNYCNKQELREREILGRIILNLEQIGESEAVGRFDIEEVLLNKRGRTSFELAGDCFRGRFIENLLVSVGVSRYREWHSLQEMRGF